MSDGSDFQELLQRVRLGDNEAATVLVRRYEPLIRRQVRLQLEDRRLGRLFDSMDVCQSVMASFFVRVAVGGFDLDAPEQLVGLLVKMARNKLASAARKATRQRRDHRRQAAGGAEALDGVVGNEATPSQQMAGRELWEQARQHLSKDELEVADLRAQGLAWAEIAERLGGNANARRMQLARAAERVANQLGLDDENDS
jgi:RNA polymerase sigma-70 factor (ECF subfamily)